MRYFEISTELEAMRIFYNEIGYPEGHIDYTCNTDGRLIIDHRTGLKGSLIEFKITEKNKEDVFNQMKRYIKAYNAKGLPLPKYGVYIVSGSEKYTVFDLEKETYSADAVISDSLDLVVDLDRKICNADRWLRRVDTQKGWIDETSIIAYNDVFFSTKGKKTKKKDDFIAELANPTVLNIKPYTWNPEGDMERKLLDCLGSTELKKRLGAFFTPDHCAKKSTEYVRNIINNLAENEDYLIVDRSAGSGNIEKFFSNEELSHCILNTIVYAEKTTLKGLYEGRVKAILPFDETIDEDGCMPAGDALSEQFNNELKSIIENERKLAEEKGKKLVVIGLENPPFAAPGGDITGESQKKKGTTDTFIGCKMKEEIKGITLQDLANKFIWSGFKYFFDYYVVYSPVKYFKSQGLVNKTFNEGVIVNRADFHATEGGISIMSWKNEDAANVSWQLENCLVKKINNKITDLISNKDEIETFGKLYQKQGLPDFKQAILGNAEYPNAHAKPILLNENNIKQALPLFAANCYTCKDYTEKEVIMKSGDGGTAYQNDNDFLEDCFLWCCLTDKNKCWSDSSKQNEMALNQNSKADQIVDLTDYRFDLFRSWRNVLGLAETCDEYNRNLHYGLAQIINDLNISEETRRVDKNGKPILRKKYSDLDETIKSFKEELKVFYSTYIEPKLFEYELLK